MITTTPVPKPRSAAVLLVDDNPANLLALDAVLSPIGIRTVTAVSPMAALSLVQHESFAAALIDVQMPEMDGFQLAQRIRQMERGRQMPILFVTAIYQDEEYVSKGYEAGAADYITKPFDPNIVRSRVKAFVDLFEQRESVHLKQVAMRTHERDEAIRRLVAFERIATAAFETSDVRSLMDELLHAFTDAADTADSAAVLLRDGDYLEVKAAVGVGDEVGARTRIGEGFAGRIAAERRPLEVSNPLWPRAESGSGTREARSLYGVPLLHGSEVLGVAQIGATRAQNFTDAEKRLFRAAADRAALAVTRHLELSSLYEILSVAPALIAIVDAAGRRYAFTNPAYTARLGLSRAPASSRDANLGPEAVRAVEAAFATGETVNVPELAVAAQGGGGSDEPSVLRVTAHPLRDASGNIDRVLIFAVDVTAQVRARQEIEATQAARAEMLEQERAARRAAESVSLAKDEFLATVSHELRTPLNAILGWATMARTKVVPDLDRALGVIERSALAQARIVEDVLDFSRIARGQMRLKLSNVDVGSVIRDALETVRPAAAAQGVKLDVDIDVPGTFTCDGPRLQQVAWNLLSNAVKFSQPSGTVKVLARLDQNALTLTVSDTGQGIERDFIPFVFEPFRQANGGSTRRHGGLGLGLAIVKEIVHAHGGTIAAASGGVGLGAEFKVILPWDGARLESERPPASAAPPSVREHARLDGVRVLVIEDDADSRDFLTEALRQRGATVMAAAGVATALASFDSFRADVLISDIAMPGADGYELIRRVRAFPAERGGAMPAIALTAHTRSEVRDLARKTGFDRLEPKPVDMERLSHAILSLLDDAESARRAAGA